MLRGKSLGKAVGSSSSVQRGQAHGVLHGGAPRGARGRHCAASRLRGRGRPADATGHGAARGEGQARRRGHCGAQRRRRRGQRLRHGHGEPTHGNLQEGVLSSGAPRARRLNRGRRRRLQLVVREQHPRARVLTTAAECGANQWRRSIGPGGGFGAPIRSVLHVQLSVQPDGFPRPIEFTEACVGAVGVEKPHHEGVDAVDQGLVQVFISHEGGILHLKAALDAALQGQEQCRQSKGHPH
mmetsp:Transcript_36179/g.92107  ORF Transcript_36179/g.92107 Transcript_36179/m.92107 type:complete len:240 (-) Transcript_36179:585-1304(-)